MFTCLLSIVTGFPPKTEYYTDDKTHQEGPSHKQIILMIKPIMRGRLITEYYTDDKTHHEGPSDKHNSILMIKPIMRGQSDEKTLLLNYATMIYCDK